MNSYGFFFLLGLYFLYDVAGNDDNIAIIVATVGNRHVLPCYYNAVGQNRPGVRWFKGPQMISYGNNVYRDKAKFNIEKPVSSEWNLVIKNVEPTDEAIYTCKVIENGQDRTLELLRLKVETKPEIDEVASTPEAIAFNEGDTRTIWCNVSGTPLPNVTWQRRFGLDGPPVDIGVSGNELTLVNITRYASDTYICKGTNPHGTSIRGITVTVKFPVSARVYQEEVTAAIGEEVSMYCMVEGEPIISAYWKNVHGEKITSGWHFEVTSTNEEGLPLQFLSLKVRDKQLTDRDYGTYICYVAGDDSEYEARVQLKPRLPQGGVVTYSV